MREPSHSQGLTTSTTNSTISNYYAGKNSNFNLAMMQSRLRLGTNAATREVSTRQQVGDVGSMVHEEGAVRSGDDEEFL